MESAYCFNPLPQSWNAYSQRVSSIQKYLPRWGEKTMDWPIFSWTSDFYQWEQFINNKRREDRSRSHRPCSGTKSRHPQTMESQEHTGQKTISMAGKNISGQRTISIEGSTRRFDSHQYKSWWNVASSRAHSNPKNSPRLMQVEGQPSPRENSHCMIPMNLLHNKVFGSCSNTMSMIHMHMLQLRRSWRLWKRHKRQKHKARLPQAADLLATLRKTWQLICHLMRYSFFLSIFFLIGSSEHGQRHSNKILCKASGLG